MNDAIHRACEGTAGFHLSVDADWVDPLEAPGVGTPVRGGATFREAHLAMELAHDSGCLLGIDFVEVNPILDIHNRTGELGADLIASAFGLRVLDASSSGIQRDLRHATEFRLRRQ
jgi:arginase